MELRPDARPVGRTQCCDAAYGRDNHGSCFSADGAHRFTLWSLFPGPDGRVPSAPAPLLLALLPNPSTATASADGVAYDPTAAKVADLARRGFDGRRFGGFEIQNAYSLVATDSDEPRANLDHHAVDPLRRLRDERTDAHTRRAIACAGAIIVGWGALLKDKPLSARPRYELRRLLAAANAPMYCWKQTRSGQPSHPLYLKKNCEPIPFVWAS